MGLMGLMCPIGPIGRGRAPIRSRRRRRIAGDEVAGCIGVGGVGGVGGVARLDVEKAWVQPSLAQALPDRLVIQMLHVLIPFLRR